MYLTDILRRLSVSREPPARSSLTSRKQLLDQLVTCRSEVVTADAAGGVGIFPLDGPGIGGVGVDVAVESASQVGNRGEDAAGEDLPFDLGEPDFNLGEPTSRPPQMTFGVLWPN